MERTPLHCEEDGPIIQSEDRCQPQAPITAYMWGPGFDYPIRGDMSALWLARSKAALKEQNARKNKKETSDQLMLVEVQAVLGRTFMGGHAPDSDASCTRSPFVNANLLSSS
ncbi:hypothetical protein OIU79_009488 [Salix purpurea]|uniref:Uncharacterized protein n=1 Tax=Salix purpurea TaxID=77065 RepID=A0A9Q0TL32_SALPP|nr:hypothetical protein OIU79_009488 [Salix purpurea]